jgi:hypothetical protein
MALAMLLSMQAANGNRRQGLGWRLPALRLGWFGCRNCNGYIGMVAHA